MATQCVQNVFHCNLPKIYNCERYHEASIQFLTFNSFMYVLGVHNNNMFWIFLFLLAAIFFLFAVNRRQFHGFLLFLLCRSLFGIRAFLKSRRRCEGQVETTKHVKHNTIISHPSLSSKSKFLFFKKHLCVLLFLLCFQGSSNFYSTDLRSVPEVNPNVTFSVFHWL